MTALGSAVCEMEKYHKGASEASEKCIQVNCKRSERWVGSLDQTVEPPAMNRLLDLAQVDMEAMKI